jgi:transposase
METVYARCAGLDVHKRSVVACLLMPGPGSEPEKVVRTFGTTMDDLLTLLDWLAAHGCTHVAMESTASFWKPIYNLLEGQLAVMVVNAQHVKNVPGRKTDVKDAEWLATLLRHGLLRASFIPPRPQRELRELTRYRTTMREERVDEVNRLQKTLEGGGIKLASVVSSIMGMSGRAILAGLVAGETDPATLAARAQGNLKAKRSELERALRGQFGPHQQFMVAQQLAHIDSLDALLARLDAEIAARLGADEEAIAHLDSVTGIGRLTAEVLLAEVGPDMSRFPSAAHLASWAGLCPGQNQSAGKQRSGRTRKGSPWLRTALVEAAKSAGRTQTYLGALYRRLAARRGPRRAAIAVAHAILVIVYHLLERHEPYQDLGVGYLGTRDQQAQQRRLVQRLERLGYEVALQPRAG